MEFLLAYQFVSNNKFCTTAGTMMYVYRFLTRDLLAVFNI